MSKGAFAKEEVMEEYLTALLNEVKPADTVQRDNVANLLEQANTLTAEAPVAEKTVETVEPPPVVEKSVQPEQAVPPAEPPQVVADYVREEAFQALFFEVAGLTLAVPLTELGGIHQIDKIGPLFGKPDWFLGMMLHREEKLNAVDTAKWVMPEKYNEKLADSLNYQYLIMLDDSSWGLACERLITTATLEPDEVKWRDPEGRRPWLAGTVKEKMCALLNVKQLIAMLEHGMSSKDQ